MSVKGKIEEAAGYLEEETGELVGNKNLANKGRKNRNAGRIENNKPPKTTPMGSGN